MKTHPLLVAGNWKMNGLGASLAEIGAVKASIGAATSPAVWIFPPATLIGAAVRLVSGSPLEIGGQDCRSEDCGAFTGDISAPMLKDAGASAVILGHSERRSLHHETSREICAKATAALKHGLKVVVCVGESKGEREAGLASAVCTRQLRESLPADSNSENTIVAYEPVWAIGTGLSPGPDDITSMHALLRAELERLHPGEGSWRMLYGGSVTPLNAARIFGSAETDGVLVGGASLNAASFLAIIAAASEAQEKKA